MLAVTKRVDFETPSTCPSVPFSVSKISAQTVWGKVSPEQFAVRVCPFDSTANAMILTDSGSMGIEFDGNSYSMVVYTVYERRQILNKGGFQYATITIPYTSWGNNSSITNLEAQTINVSEKGKIKKRRRYF